MNLDRELEVAKQAAFDAGRRILEIYKEDFDIQYKNDHSPVTKADYQANKIIIDKLKKIFPDYALLSEEEKDDLTRTRSDWCWIIDPLDGTKEFIKRNGEFTVNIALAYKQKPVLGVVYIPVMDELYYGIYQNGAYFEKEHHIKRIFVSERVENIRAVCSRSHTSNTLIQKLEETGITNRIYIGSSIKGCLIAKGEAEIYYRFGPTSEWDTAAVQCIVEEAGGIFKQIDHTDMTYNRKDTLNRKGFYILNRIENRLEIGEEKRG